MKVPEHHLTVDQRRRDAEWAAMPLEQKINKLEGDVEGWSQKWLEQVNKHSDTRAEVRRLTAEVERLRLTEDEVGLIRMAQTICVMQGSPGTAAALWNIAARLGGGA